MLLNRTLLAACLLGVSAPAVAAKQYLDIQPAEGQTSRYEQGIEALDSDLPQSSARVFEPSEKTKKRTPLRIMVYNAGGEPLNFGPESVTVETVAGEAVAVIPYEKLLKEEKNRQMWAAIGAGLGAAGNSISASQAGYNSGSFNAYGNRGSWVSGNYNSYNGGQAYAAQSLANMQNQQLFQRLGETNRQGVEALGVNLRTTTIDPGGVFGGQVMIELPKGVRSSKKPVDLLVHVKVGAETHTFRAQLVRR